MQGLVAEKRVIFITDSSDDKKIAEAKFKLAELHSGYGKLDKTHYWSVPEEQCDEGYKLLKSLFKNVQRY